MRVVRELKLQQLASKGMKLEAVNPVSSILQSWAADSELTVTIVTLAIQKSEEGQALGRSPGSGSKRGSVGVSMAASTCQLQEVLQAKAGRNSYAKIFIKECLDEMA